MGSWDDEAVSITKGELATVLEALEAGWVLADQHVDFVREVLLESAIDIVARRLLPRLPPTDDGPTGG